MNHHIRHLYLYILIVITIIIISLQADAAGCEYQTGWNFTVNPVTADKDVFPTYLEVCS